jgi:hypothetical protein
MKAAIVIPKGPPQLDDLKFPKLNLEGLNLPNEQIGGSPVHLGRWSTQYECGTAMCDQRKTIDKRIEHYRRINSSIADQLTVDRIKELIIGLEAQKADFHLEQDK